jgi:prevent-host-death family protein
MPTDIGAYEAKTHLPALLERVARGERFTITKHGRPIARLVPIARTGSNRRREAIERFKAVPRKSNLGRSGQAAHQRRPAVTDLVLDPSVALSWCFKNEATTAGDRVLERLVDEAASVPAIWHLEIANVLALSERRGRITQANSSQFIALLETLVMIIDEETPSRALGRVFDLARAERLTAYHAAYLELAMRLAIPLASKDADLCDAAAHLGVSVLRAA